MIASLLWTGFKMFYVHRSTSVTVSQLAIQMFSHDNEYHWVGISAYHLPAYQSVQWDSIDLKNIFFVVSGYPIPVTRVSDMLWRRVNLILWENWSLPTVHMGHTPYMGWVPFQWWVALRLPQYKTQ